jgi:hypothetical protein
MIEQICVELSPKLAGFEILSILFGCASLALGVVIWWGRKIHPYAPPESCIPKEEQDSTDYRRAA